MGTHSVSCKSRKMLKLVLFLFLAVFGSLAKNLPRNDEDWTEEDVRNVIHLVFCACDEEDYDHELSLEEYTSPVCEAINDHLFGYQVTAEDFWYMDENKDGHISVDEVFDAISKHAGGRKGSFKTLRDFSDNVHVEAAVRVIGCACDNDGNMALSWEEVSSEQCVAVQNWVFGQNIDEEGFNMVDADGNGEMDGQEAADALEYVIENENGDDDDDDNEEWNDEDIYDVIHLVFCACDEERRDHELTVEEFTSPVCEAVNEHLFGYQVNEDDFRYMDKNRDGHLSVDEVFNAIKKMPSVRRREPIAIPNFSDNVHVEAAVRVIGCACDNDGNMALSWEEVSSEQCVAVQNWVFGDNIDEEGFNMADTDGNGEVDGQEAADAFEGH